MNDKDLANFESAEYTSWMIESGLPRTLLGGTKAMRFAGQEYLPKNKFETDPSYANRLKRSFLFNAYRQTCSFLSGQVFQKAIEWDEKNEAFFEDYKKDIDKKGNQIDVFAKRVFFNGIGKGVSHIMVEVPNKEPATTKAEEKALGIRPYLREVMPEDLIGFFDEDDVLIQVRIKGVKEEKDGKYGKKQYNTVLILFPGGWEYFISDDKGEFGRIPDEKGTTSLDYIPLVSFIPGEEVNIVQGITPLNDLTHMNEKHWQSSSDQTNILHVARVAVLFGKKIDVKQIPIGAAQMINSNEEGADLKYVEIQGTAIGAGRQDLEDTKSEMALWGLQQLVPRTGNLTATEKSLSSSESNSSLATWAIEFEDTLESALRMMGDFMGQKIEGDIVKVNKEYFLGLDSAILEIILKTVDMGISSRQMAFGELKRRGIYETDYTWEDAKAEIEDDARNNTTFKDLASRTLGEDEE
jgi:Domain of unknown function (DUF4055)